MPTGLVLGAGGFAGEAFHRGVVRALTDVGHDPHGSAVVVGTSAGSVTAATLRRGAGPPLRFTENRAGALLPQRHDLLRLLHTPRSRINAALLWPEFTAGRRDLTFVRDAVRDRVGDEWPDAPLWIVAVRRRDGRRVVFGRPGEPSPAVSAAVAASCAIPGYFTPIEIDGVEYVDGGVHSPTNADLLAAQDLDLIVVSSPMSVERSRAAPRADLPIRVWFRHLLRQELWTLRRPGRRLVTVEPDRATLRAMGLNMMRAHRLAQVEQAAYALTRRRLAEALGRVRS